MPHRPTEGLLAIAAWQGRVSPVFDAARELVLIGLQDIAPRRTSPSEDSLPPWAADPAERWTAAAIEGDMAEPRVRRLLELRARVLICGAVSRPLDWEVRRAGILLVSFVAGSVVDVLRAYAEDRLDSPEYRMPGCRGRGGRGRASCARTGDAGRVETIALEQAPRSRLAPLAAGRRAGCRVGEDPGSAPPGCRGTDRALPEEDAR